MTNIYLKNRILFIIVFTLIFVSCENGSVKKSNLKNDQDEMKLKKEKEIKDSLDFVFLMKTKIIEMKNNQIFSSFWIGMSRKEYEYVANIDDISPYGWYTFVFGEENNNEEVTFEQFFNDEVDVKQSSFQIYPTFSAEDKLDKIEFTLEKRKLESEKTSIDMSGCNCDFYPISKQIKKNLLRLYNLKYKNKSFKKTKKTVDFSVCSENSNSHKEIYTFIKAKPEIIIGFGVSPGSVKIYIKKKQ